MSSVGPRRLKRACQAASGPMRGTSAATMRGGSVAPDGSGGRLRCSSTVGGTSSPPAPLATADTQ